jgi:hypothetical protein
MKLLWGLFIILSLVIYIGCKGEKESETEELIQTPGETSSTTSPSMPQLSDDDYVSIYEAQEMIKIYPDDRSFREKYCQQAYLKDHHIFISMGIGRLTNPKNGRRIPQHLAERAAKLDAQRWSGYGEKWLKDNFDSPFGKLEHYSNKPVTVLNQSIIGDSLFVFVATTIDIP